MDQSISDHSLDSPVTYLFAIAAASTLAPSNNAGTPIAVRAGKGSLKY
jgi:hypothetical protein